VGPQLATAQPDPGFSRLDEITVENAGRLVPAWSFRTGTPGAHATAPLIAGDTLFVLTPFPHTLFALDLTRPGAAVKWRYMPPPDRTADGLTCCDAATGGLAASGDRLYLNTLDGHTISLDAAGGQVVWDARPAHPQTGETLAAAPLVAGNRIIIGSAGDDAGPRGWLAALDAATGRQDWKVFDTGPDAEVGIGEGFRPLYDPPQARDRGVSTWPPAAWQQGGGGLSGAPVADPALGLVFYQTGHPAPWNPDQRPGENRWTSGIFARDAASGAARWFDPINPHDLYAMGASGGLLPTPDGRLVHPDANGFLYVLDPATGKMLSATRFLPVNAARGIDLASAVPIREDRYVTVQDRTVRDICPAWPAGSNAQAAYSPATGLLYIPAATLCMDMAARSASYIAGTPFGGADVRVKPAPGGEEGALIAWDIAAGRAAWTVPERFPLRGGALATAGSVVFYGTLDGLLKAVDARTGRGLWQFQATAGIVGRPASFRAPDGHQYVAVLAGAGGLTGTASAKEIDVRDATAARGFANALRTLPPPQDRSGTLFVFRLP